jgi:hypothetical protein
MIEELLLVGGVSAVGLTLAHKYNLIPQVFNNPQQRWWWEPQVVTVVKYIERPVVAMSEPLIQSKYLVTAQSNPGEWTQPKRGTY